MNTDRRSLLKGIAVAGMVIPGMHWAYALPVDMGQQGLSWPIEVTALTSDAGIDEAFLSGVRMAAKAGGRRTTELPLKNLDTATYSKLHRLLGDAQTTLLVGLLNDAAATLTLDLVRSHGGRVLSVQEHRIAIDADPWAASLGQALVSHPTESRANPASMAEAGRAFVSLSCVV